MALETNFGEDAHLFVGSDVPVFIGGGLNADGNSYHILAAPGSPTSAVVNVAAFAMEFAIRLTLEAVSPMFTLTTGAGEITVGGVYNSSQASNTQYVRCFISDTNSLLLAPVTGTSTTYYWTLKRTDADLETVIAFGTMLWQFAATR